MSTTFVAPSTGVSESNMEKGVLGDTAVDQAAIQDQSDVSDRLPEKAAQIAWEDDPRNALNWPTWKKVHLIVMLSSFGFVSYAHHSFRRGTGV